MYPIRKKSKMSSIICSATSSTDSRARHDSPASSSKRPVSCDDSADIVSHCLPSLSPCHLPLEADLGDNTSVFDGGGGKCAPEGCDDNPVV
jgi:hypothetical protein